MPSISSGWQVAADSNVSGSMYPDQSLYPANSGPELARKINKTLQRADQIEHMRRRRQARLVRADRRRRGGRIRRTAQLLRDHEGLYRGRRAGVHFEDQLASEKKCGHLGGKVLIPTQAAIRNLDAARLAADVCGVPTIIVARTDAESAKLITSDVDERDRPFLTGERTAEGFFRLKDGTGLDHCIARGLAFAPTPICSGARPATRTSTRRARFADAIHAQFPGKLLAYNCSPELQLGKPSSTRGTIARFQAELGAMGYKFQFVTLAGFHSLNHAMFELASDYRDRGMAAYSRAAAGRVRQRGGRLHRDPPPARGRHRLLRRGRAAPFPAAAARPSRSRNPPKPRSFTQVKRSRPSKGGR